MEINYHHIKLKEGIFKEENEEFYKKQFSAFVECVNRRINSLNKDIDYLKKHNIYYANNYWEGKKHGLLGALNLLSFLWFEEEKE